MSELDPIVAAIPAAADKRALVERYVRAVGRIDPGLLPRERRHPLAAAITAGPTAYPALLDRYKVDAPMRPAILDALAIMIEVHGSTPVVTAHLLGILIGGEAPYRSLAGRGLALAGHRELLEAERGVLRTDAPPDAIRAACFLLGLGRYKAALPELLALLRRDRPSTIDAAIWAVGRVGTEDAVFTLHAMLESGFMPEHVAGALAEAGDASSVAKLLAAQEPREVLVRAASSIAVRNAERLRASSDAKGLRDAFSKLTEDRSPLVRYFAIVGHGALGGRMPENRLLAAIGAEMDKASVDPMTAFFAGRGKKK